MAEINEHHRQQGACALSGCESPPVASTASGIISGELIVVADPWQSLRQFTQARIALGRVGTSLPTREVLGFGYAHAMARDAVHLPLDVDSLSAGLVAAGWSSLALHSCAMDRTSYLLRPDLGRRLHATSLAQLQAIPIVQPADLLIVVGDGLSALAIHNHALPLIAEIRKLAPPTWQWGQVVLVSQARVAVADEIGECLGARMVAMLIGERPGLSSPDSLGIYLTYRPKLGRTDAERNCISNIRLAGLSYTAAAKKLLWLATQSMRLQLSGVALKDESDMPQLTDSMPVNFA